MNAPNHQLSIIPLATLLFAGGALYAQQPVLKLNATTVNVAGAPDGVRIDVLRWSTDAERDQLIQAWVKPVAPAPAGGRGRGRGAPDPTADAAAGGDDAAGAAAGAAPAAAARGGGGGRGGAAAGGRGGRGGRGGGEPAAPVTPESSLASALEKAPTVGYLWSSEVAGYALRYAGKFAEPDGGQKVVLVTERRLGAWNDAWKPASGDTTTGYEFSVIELRLNAKGEGEGKASLTGKIVVDGSGKTIGLQDYAALPVILKSVKHRTS